MWTDKNFRLKTLKSRSKFHYTFNDVKVFDYELKEYCHGCNMNHETVRKYLYKNDYHINYKNVEIRRFENAR